MVSKGLDQLAQRRAGLLDPIEVGARNCLALGRFAITRLFAQCLAQSKASSYRHGGPRLEAHRSRSASNASAAPLFAHRAHRFRAAVMRVIGGSASLTDLVV